MFLFEQEAKLIAVAAVRISEAIFASLIFFIVTDPFMVCRKCQLTAVYLNLVMF